MMLGNLSLEQIQIRAGVRFSKELIEFMEPRRQPLAEGVKPGQWHCFDLPFALLCGDLKTATEIHEHLKDQSEEFEETLQISVQRGNK